MTTSNKATEAKLQANRRGDILLANNFSFTTPYSTDQTYQCNVYLTQYPNGQNCIRLEDNIYGEPIAHATASVNLYANDIVHQKACDDHVVIKDYCENAGMLKRLQDAGIVGETVLHINGIHSGLHMCELEVDNLVTAITDANKDKPTGDDRYDIT